MSQQKSLIASKIIEIILNAEKEHSSYCIIFSYKKSRKQLYISNKHIYALDSTEVTEKFSALLVMAKLLSREELKSLVTTEPTIWELDKSLILTKNLSSDKVKKIFSLQLSRIVKSLLDWPSINYKLKPGTFGDISDVKIPLYQEELLLHLYRLSPDKETVDHIRRNKDQSFFIRSNQFSKLKTLPFNSQEGYLISALKSGLTPSQIEKLNKMSAKNLYETLAVFHKLNFLSSSHEEDSAAPEASVHDSKDIPLIKSDDISREPYDDKGEHVLDTETLELRIQEFSEILSDFDEKDYFQIFDISPDEFSMSEIKSKYHSFVKKYHPDKFRRHGSDDLNNVLETILNKINTAYETLQDPEKLKEYQKLQLSPTRDNSSVVSGSRHVAVENFIRGKNLINAQHYVEAISFLERAVRIKPDNGDYHAYLAYAMSKSVQYRRRAEEHFLKAIELAPMNINTYIHLGRMYKEASLFTKAIKIFQEALQWDPENRIALDALAEIQKKQKGKSKTFLNKLFGK